MHCIWRALFRARPVRAVVTIIASCLIAMVASFAPACRATELSVGAGVAVSVGEFARSTDYGLSGTIGIGIAPFRNSSDLLIIGRVSYDAFHGALLRSRNTRFASAGIEMKLRFPREISGCSYVALGGGLVHVTYRDASSTARNNPYVSPAIGVEVGSAGHRRLFLEGRFVYISGGAVSDVQFVKAMIGVIL